MSVLVTPDLEALFPAALYDALKSKYPRLYTDRAAPSNLSGRPVVVCHREGGVSRDRLLDQARIAVDVYAPTEKAVNGLALDAHAVVESLHDRAPIVKVVATGPSPILGAVPQRRFYADVLIRKTKVEL